MKQSLFDIKKIRLHLTLGKKTSFYWKLKFFSTNLKKDQLFMKKNATLTMSVSENTLKTSYIEQSKSLLKLHTDKKEKKIFLTYKLIKKDWVQSHI